MRATTLIIPAIITLTSLLIYGVGLRQQRLSGSSFRAALGQLLEFIGLIVAVFLANILVAVGLGLMSRIASISFISLYVAGDITLLILSALQALLFWLWWRAD
jgi:hypothetical protein